MFSWKERLYAFLLKRILGQYLSIESQQKLYQRIQQASVIDGSYIFNDIELNTEYISLHLLRNVVHIARATIRTISIDIRLEEVEAEQTDNGNSSTASNTVNHGDNDGCEQQSTTNTNANTKANAAVWKAFKFGISTAATANSTQEKQQQQQQSTSTTAATLLVLVVHVRIEGLTIVIEPSNRSMDDNTDPSLNSTLHESSLILEAPTTTTTTTGATTTTTTTTTTGARSYISSFIDAVLKSLRLSVQLHDIRIRARCSNSCSSSSSSTDSASTTGSCSRNDIAPPLLHSSYHFIETYIQSIYYHHATSDSINDVTRRNMELDINQIRIVTGSSIVRWNVNTTSQQQQQQHDEDQATMVVAQIDGTSHLSFQEIKSTNIDATGQSFQEEKRNVEQQIEVALNENVTISVDMGSLQLIRIISDSFVISSHPSSNTGASIIEKLQTSNHPSPQSQSILFANEFVERQQQEQVHDIDDNDDDTADYRTLESILTQYREARLLVEKREVRGGILVPSLSDSGDVSFDAFFDANEYFDAPHTIPNVEKDRNKAMRVNVSCPSITFLLPIPTNDIRISPLLFDRAGYISESTLIYESVIGITCDQLIFETHRSFDQNGISIVAAETSCHSIIAFVRSPICTIDPSVYRLDFLCICGRTEVDPYTPISIQYNQLSKHVISNDGNDNNNDNNSSITLLESLFPRVPNLSSFKARQEDDDNVTNEFLMNGSDPQSTMTTNLNASDTIITVNIPEIIMDLSVGEIVVIQKIIRSMNCQSPRPVTVNAPIKGESIQQRQSTISIKCDSIRLALHVDDSDTSRDRSVLRLSLDRFNSFFLINSNAPNHLRLLVHDFDFIEVLHRDQQDCPIEPSSPREKVSSLRIRGSHFADSIVNPILYRSYLFTPISPSSPSIHIDVLNFSHDNTEDATTTIYLNFFHMSYRHAYDCFWIHRLINALSVEDSATKPEPTPTIRRIFVSAIDFNFDYTPPHRFQTASRTIVRIGDLRVSSNVVIPTPTKQAFRCTCSDTEILFCNNRFPYNYENSMMIDAEMMRPDDVTLHSLGFSDNMDSDDVLRLMNYKSMATAEEIDLHVVFTNGERAPSDPLTLVTVSTRQIYFFACRDSLSRFLNTIGQATNEMTAIPETNYNDLKQKSLHKSLVMAENVTKKDISRKAHPHFQKSDTSRDFLLDGYDWTAIDCAEIGQPVIPPGEEQSTRWYHDTTTLPNISTIHDHGRSLSLKDDDYYGDKVHNASRNGPSIILHHFDLQPVVDPIADGDMGAATYAGSDATPIVKTRIVVRDLSLRIRFFDGYDWPEQLSKVALGVPRPDLFVIPEVKKKTDDKDANPRSNKSTIDVELDKKSKLLEDLLIDETKLGNTFKDIPLPQDGASTVKEQAEVRRLSRRTNKYCQVEVTGVVVRLDTMEESEDHRLVSCLNLTVHDLFLIETISSQKPVKMLGEWFNEDEHPRDSKEGLVFMKIVTWHPVMRVTDEGRVGNDESDVVLKIHPLRCILDQRAISFIRALFNTGIDHGDIEVLPDQVLPAHLHVVPPPIFTMFRVQPLKLKIDYVPQQFDTNALRNGAIVELINLIPLDGMVLLLQTVQIKNVIGFGPAMSIVVGQWVEYICATQLHKFVTKSRPFEPISQIGSAAKDLIVLPWEAFQNGESVKKAVKVGAKTFSKVAMYEAFNTASRIANFVSSQVSNISTSGANLYSDARNVIPERPDMVPKTIFDTAPHAWDSLSRGLQEANYKIVIIPYREYHRNGVYGAASSVVRGIPVAIGAPTSGAAEALSYTLLGVRNQIRPDIRKEDEATLRGLNQN